MACLPVAILIATHIFEFWSVRVMPVARSLKGTQKVLMGCLLLALSSFPPSGDHTLFQQEIPTVVGPRLQLEKQPHWAGRTREPYLFQTSGSFA